SHSGPDHRDGSDWDGDDWDRGDWDGDDDWDGSEGVDVLDGNELDATPNGRLLTLIWLTIVACIAAGLGAVGWAFGSGLA
ncbi:MAG: hypothetical protein WBG39_12175, partial [Gordonia sp. (in: high G+C Gram-positive bacteria)]